MNISDQLISGKCDNKCSFSFDYKKETGVAGNYRSGINITRDGSSDVVKFNADEYFAEASMIYRSSFFKYNNFDSDGLMMIGHANKTISSNKLYVCIPLYSSGSHTKSNAQLTNILTSVARAGNAAIEIPDISLNDFVPQKEYYSFKRDDIQWIVFSRENGIYLDDENAELLKSLLIDTGGSLPSGPEVFLSTRKAINGTGDIPSNDEIYIDCQPTGSSEDEIDVTNTKKSTFDFTDMIINSQATIFILVFIAVIIVIFIIHSAIMYGSSV
jgi:hypothetical protein